MYRGLGAADTFPGGAGGSQFPPAVCGDTDAVAPKSNVLTTLVMSL
jgi:hypothetical protein